MLKELKIKLENDLNKSLISSSCLLDNLSIMNEDSRKSSSYVDPKNIPFYYYLGKHFISNNLLEIGVGAGLNSACYLKSVKLIDNYLGFQQKTSEFYTKRFAEKNIKKNVKSLEIYHGNINDKEFNEKLIKNKWNLAIFDIEESYDKTLFKLTEVWKNLNYNALLVINQVKSSDIINKVFVNFLKINNVGGEILNTRYGVGLILK
jgi:hypothetical protein